MFTFEGESARSWRRPWALRVLLALVGVGSVFVGLVLWGMEQEKGGWEGSGLGHHVVGYDEETDEVVVWNEAGEIVFSGTEMGEADAWIESQRNRNFTVPILIMAGGGLLIALGVAPNRAPRGLDAGGRPDRASMDEEGVEATWSPWRAQPSEGRWWLVVGSAAAIGFGIAFFVALILAFGIAYDMQTPWSSIVVFTPLALAGVATAAIGGVKGWWLMIPAGVSYLLVFLEFVEDLPTLTIPTIWWALTVGATALIRWFAAGPSPDRPGHRGAPPRAVIRT